MLVEVQTGLTFLKGSLRIRAQNFNMCISFDLAFSLFDIYHKEIVENVKKKGLATKTVAAKIRNNEI